MQSGKERFKQTPGFIRHFKRNFVAPRQENHACSRSCGQHIFIDVFPMEAWHCTNPACHCEVLVRSNGEIEGSNPRCVYGAPMKEKYSPPLLTYLGFLKVEDPIPAREFSRKG
jgi:hypothetical protein